MEVDLNADLGESYGAWRLGNDEALLSIITSANVACGFHAGDPTTVRQTCAMALARGVRIGAHVSYPDLVGFGRRRIDVAPADLTADVIYQLGALTGLARSVGGTVTHLKPHGALYHAVSADTAPADAVVEAVLAVDDSLAVLGFPGSALLDRAAARGLRTITEHFVDRRYGADGRLIDRRQPNALITDAEVAAERTVTAARSGAADSFCVHGDTPDAVRIAETVRTALSEAGILVRAFG